MIWFHFVFSTSSVSVRLWNLFDNCQFYKNFLRTFFNNITNFNKVLQDNLRNRWANILRLLPSWITASIYTITPLTTLLNDLVPFCFSVPVCKKPLYHPVKGPGSIYFVFLYQYTITPFTTLVNDLVPFCFSVPVYKNPLDHPLKWSGSILFFHTSIQKKPLPPS